MQRYRQLPVLFFIIFGVGTSSVAGSFSRFSADIAHSCTERL
jgi:hypothetical protein